MKNSLSLNQLDSQIILESFFLKSYQETLDLIQRELLRLNSYLFVLEKVGNFQSDIILGPQKQSFLSLVMISFTESSILLITKLVTDNSSDALSIKRFIDRISQNVKEKYKETFFSLIKENKCNETLITLKKQAKEFKDIRDNLIAHLLIDQSFHLKYSTNKVSLEKLKEITSKINKLFDLLCFNCEYMLLPIDYDPRVQHPVGSDARSDIEYILDLIIQDSYLYKMPESQYWNRKKEGLSPDILKIINEYRRKFGKPEV